MIPEIYHEEKEVLEATQSFPSVSIVLPFEPKMSSRTELEYRLNRAMGKITHDLEDHQEDASKLVLEKLKGITGRLDYSTYKKSIAIFVSPILEKIYYLDIPVEEKIMIDQSFEIRDLVYCKKDIHKYLVLVLNSKTSRIFLGNTTAFFRIAFNTPSHVAAVQRDLPERVSNFSTVREQKEVLLDKFLHQIDTALGIILAAYDLPIFVLGPEKVVGHFKKISHHHTRITGFVAGNFEDATEPEIREAIAPHVSNWENVRQSDLLHKLDDARSAKRLSQGMHEVLKVAGEKRGRLLVVEKNFMYPADNASIAQSFIKDAVDDVLEKVLANGGDVEFVDPGVLKDYEHIALIRYY